MLRLAWAPIVLVSILAAACARSDTDAGGTPAGTPAATTAATLTATLTGTPASSPADAGETPRASATTAPTDPTALPAPAAPATPATPTASPAPDAPPALHDTMVTRLAIPALGIDSGVSVSRTVPDTSPTPPGCPATPPGQETLTVPASGIATPEVAFEGLENKAWIYGHSRWQGEPGLFFALQRITVGDELFIDGFDRQTGDAVTRQRFLVEDLYLADKDSGATLVVADSPSEIPTRPTVILQTSVRESGAGKPWILDQGTVLAKASNLVEGDIDDPCKYLLLFVIARAA